jgi:hypothetical protein
MSTYIFSCKSDSSNEPIDKKEFKSKEDAILYWSQIKQLTVQQFNELYVVSKFHKG